MSYENRIKREYKNLLVWSASMEIVKEIYLISRADRFKSDFPLINQIRRSAISIPSNIVEGYERNNSKQFRQFLRYAKASAAETRCQVEIAYRIGYISKESYLSIETKLMKLGYSLGALIKKVSLECS